MDRKGLLALAEYHAYANRRLFAVAEKMSPEQFATPGEYSHGSVQRMLRHMLGTEVGFLALCQGRVEQRAPESLSFAELRERFETTDQAMIDYICRLDAVELERTVEFAFSSGQPPLQLPVWQIMVQVFVHATHHRGELSIIMTALGFPLPTPDIIIQFVQESGQTWPF